MPDPENLRGVEEDEEAVGAEAPENLRGAEEDDVPDTAKPENLRG